MAITNENIATNLNNSYLNDTFDSNSLLNSKKRGIENSFMDTNDSKVNQHQSKKVYEVFAPSKKYENEQKHALNDRLLQKLIVCFSYISYKNEASLSDESLSRLSEILLQDDHVVGILKEITGNSQDSIDYFDLKR